MTKAGSKERMREHRKESECTRGLAGKQKRRHINRVNECIRRRKRGANTKSLKKEREQEGRVRDACKRRNKDRVQVRERERKKRVCLSESDTKNVMMR